ncbi:hypothetical protein IL306_000307 [Fusarium sp. DS 682]|nr:hypothetical protein IL306_000307 [Fusarium sp. DS 682]
MASPPTLDTLPSEIQLQIFSQVTPHDLSVIARISKSLNEIVTPLLWNDIEFHEEGYHESNHELKVPPPARDPTRRPYHSKRLYGPGTRMKAVRFFGILQRMHRENPGRLEQITKRVKHLCTVIDHLWRFVERNNDFLVLGGIQVWHLLPYFSNLETLELYGGWYYSEEEEKQVSEITGPPLKLRFLKLSGYMPREVPAWLLKAGDTLERLELDMLGQPISTQLSHDPERFKPLPSEKLGMNDDDESDYGSLSGEIVIPRPLGDFLTAYEGELRLPKLRHLLLGQPAQSTESSDFMEYSWSKRAETSCYDNWRKILKASIKTLKTLVLEQRPAADYFENRGCSEEEWMEERICSHASQTLLEIVETAISEADSVSLGSVYLYGIAAGTEEDGYPAGEFMQFLEDRGVECEARRGKWCFFDKQDGTVVWCPWDAAYDSDEDEDIGENYGSKTKWDTVLMKV